MTQGHIGEYYAHKVITYENSIIIYSALDFDLVLFQFTRIS